MYQTSFMCGRVYVKEIISCQMAVKACTQWFSFILNVMFHIFWLTFQQVILYLCGVVAQLFESL